MTRKIQSDSRDTQPSSFFTTIFRNYPISFAKTQENISQILLKSEEKRKVAANLLCWKCKAENMENCYEKGEIEICDGRLVRIWKHRLPESLGGFSRPRTVFQL